GDARWLRQALLAVIDNALKFSPIGGTLQLGLRREPTSARVTAAAEGPGGLAAGLPRPVDAHYHAQAGPPPGGTAPGPAARRGGVGGRAARRLDPRREPAPARLPLRPVAAAGAGGVNVLLVEDDVGIGRFVSQGLAARGFQVRWERSGRDVPSLVGSGAFNT